MKKAVLIAVTAGLAGIAGPAEAQLFYVGIRGGAAIPTGAFGETGATAEDQLVQGAKTGFGYGLDAGINLGPIGIYAGFDKMRFECAEGSCSAPDSKLKLQGVSAGVRLSIPLFPIVKPWVKGGVTFSELETQFGPASSMSQFSSERTPGYELGAGVDIPFLGGFFSLTPQVRYVGQKLDYKVPGVTSGDTTTDKANFYTVDLGLRIRSPI